MQNEDGENRRYCRLDEECDRAGDCVGVSDRKEICKVADAGHNDTAVDDDAKILADSGGRGMPGQEHDHEQDQRAGDEAHAGLGESPDPGDRPFAHDGVCAKSHCCKDQDGDAERGVARLDVPRPDHKEDRNKADAEGDPFAPVHFLAEQEMRDQHGKKRICADQRGCGRGVAVHDADLVRQHADRDAHGADQCDPAEITRIHTVTAFAAFYH